MISGVLVDEFSKHSTPGLGAPLSEASACTLQSVLNIHVGASSFQGSRIEGLHCRSVVAGSSGLN